MSKSNLNDSPVFTRKRGLLATLATLVVFGCVQNQPMIESGLAQLQKQFFSEINAAAELEAELRGELPEDEARESYRYLDATVIPVVQARAETKPVASFDDAADDPAIWIHPTDPTKSLVLGTDKKAGIGVYDLSGSQKQFLPAGLPNNIDLRQSVTVGNWSGDLAVSSNRADNGVTVFSVNENGLEMLGGFAADTEPYGMGRVDGATPQVIAFVTYKNGIVKGYQIDQVAPNVIASEVGAYQFGTQLEGCVHDDATNTLYVGEEAAGIWQLETSLTASLLLAPVVIDRIGEDTGLIADVEGVALYNNGRNQYLVVSSQGNDSYAVYDAKSPYDFKGRFRIGAGPAIDGAQETDGLEANATPIGNVFPAGILVVQDGFNGPYGSPQNFKIVDWRDIADALSLPR